MKLHVGMRAHAFLYPKGEETLKPMMSTEVRKERSVRKQVANIPHDTTRLHFDDPHDGHAPPRLTRVHQIAPQLNVQRTGHRALAALLGRRVRHIPRHLLHPHELHVDALGRVLQGHEGLGPEGKYESGWSGAKSFF